MRLRTLTLLALLGLAGCSTEPVESQSNTSPETFEAFEGGEPCGDQGACADGTWCRWNKCVECRDRSDCSVDKPLCVTGQCMECSIDAECHGAYPTRPWCEDGRCVPGTPYGTYKGEE